MLDTCSHYLDGECERHLVAVAVAIADAVAVVVAVAVAGVVAADAIPETLRIHDVVVNTSKQTSSADS